MLKRIFELKRRYWAAGENFIMTSSIICILHQILLRLKLTRWVERVTYMRNRT
jgi:hypothetical protein